MSRRKKRYASGNPALRNQVSEVKSYGPFLSYLRSRAFIKNALIGCFYPLIAAVSFIQDQSPGWCFAALLVPLILFPFAKVTIERLGLLIAPVHFWQKYRVLDSRTQNFIEIMYWLLITMLVLPLAIVYCIQLYVDKASRRA